MTRPEREALLTWLFARQRFGMRPGLRRMRRLLACLGDPHERYRSVLVGGTNGKGSTAAVLAAALHAGGERVGLTTSPHLQNLVERVAVDGEAVEEEALLDGLAQVRPHAERVGATFFETVTATAMLTFAEAGVTTAVLEVGMGGRFDATNVVGPALSLVTSVALDHTTVLGDSLRAIAHEKAGIFRPGTPAWTGAEGEALGCLREAAAANEVALRALAEDADVQVHDLGWQGLELAVAVAGRRLAARTPLVGAHQAGNVALALIAADTLGVPASAAAGAAALTRWPGRLERVAFRRRWLVLDGAHNPAAAAALARALQVLEVRVPVLILGISQDKDVAGVVGALAPAAERVIATRAASSPRALAPSELARLAEVRPVDNLPDAIELAIRWTGPEDVIVVAGSLFLAGEARALARGAPGEGRQRWQ